MAFEEKTLHSELVFRGQLVNLRKDEVETVDGTSFREIVEHCPGAAIVALKEDGSVIMERQYRKPLEGVAYEIPAGKVEPGEEPLKAAIRELKEETGYTADKMRFLTAAYPTIGYCTEKLFFYLATGLCPGETNLDPNESIDIEEVPFEKVLSQVMRGETIDAKAQIGILMTNELIRSGELEDYLK
ncbi:MAG: NUDIX hydrolase [Eubacteriales bacterium]|nr:NUDIX hydrolase [Eubacteriales bacterium]